MQKLKQEYQKTSLSIAKLQERADASETRRKEAKVQYAAKKEKYEDNLAISIFHGDQNSFIAAKSLINKQETLKNGSSNTMTDLQRQKITQNVRQSVSNIAKGRTLKL